MTEKSDNYSNSEDNQHQEIKIKQPPVLFQDTQKIIEKLALITDRKIICYWTSSRGNVCNNDVIVLNEILEKIGTSKKAGIFIKSYGGNIEASLRMVNLLREYFDDLVAYIPLECASAATMICLGANEIQMGALAYMSPIDSSLTHNLSPIDPTTNSKVSVSQDELIRLVNLWHENAKDNSNPYSHLFHYIHPLVIGAIDRSRSLSIKICTEILSYHIRDLFKCEKISHHLNSDYPSHSYPITFRQAEKIGLNVKVMDKEINKNLLQLNSLYSEMAQKALTDYDEFFYHDNEILNIQEAEGIQIFYQNEADWKYIKEERRCITTDDHSSWKKIEMINGHLVNSILYIR